MAGDKVTRVEIGDTQFNSGTEAQMSLRGKRGLARPTCQPYVGWLLGSGYRHAACPLDPLGTQAYRFGVTLEAE